MIALESKRLNYRQHLAYKINDLLTDRTRLGRQAAYHQAEIFLGLSA